MMVDSRCLEFARRGGHPDPERCEQITYNGALYLVAMWSRSERPDHWKWIVFDEDLHYVTACSAGSTAPLEQAHVRIQKAMG